MNRVAGRDRPRVRTAWLVPSLGLLVIGALLPQPQARADDSALALTDLPEYRRALVARESDPRPEPVSYRTLWDRSAAYQGKRVQVEGRVVRRFHQGGVGTFPPLVEAWAVTTRGEPFCLVYPAPRKGTPAPTGPAEVRFVGTYLKRIRYAGGDVDRLAPLIVGPQPPTVADRPSPFRALGPQPRPGSNRRNDWLLAAGAGVVVVMVLAWHALRKPSPRTADVEGGPAPRFDDGRDDAVDVGPGRGGQETSNDDRGVGRD